MWSNYFRVILSVKNPAGRISESCGVSCASIFTFLSFSSLGVFYEGETVPTLQCNDKCYFVFHSETNPCGIWGKVASDCPLWRFCTAEISQSKLIAYFFPTCFVSDIFSRAFTSAIFSRACCRSHGFISFSPVTCFLSFVSEWSFSLGTCWLALWFLWS